MSEGWHAFWSLWWVLFPWEWWTDAAIFWRWTGFCTALLVLNLLATTSRLAVTALWRAITAREER